MSEKPSEFVIPAAMSVAGLKSKLRDYVQFSEDSTKTLKRIYYDTFDWRIYADGGTLESEQSRGALKLYWRDLDSGKLRNSQTVDRLPSFVWDLPTGSLQEHLEPVLEMRALTPQIKLTGKVHALRVLDKRQKTVLRLNLEQTNVSDPDGGRPRQLEKRLKVLPVRGYDKTTKQVTKILAKELGLHRGENDLMVTALAAVGRRPGGYSSKLNLKLDPEMRADEATKLILLRLLDTMEANLEGTRKDIDSEFLHDFRVAIRRTRSALGQIKDVLPQNILDRFRPEFAWLGQITSPTRDMDVWLLSFEKYRDSLPASVRDDLEPLREFLQNHQKLEQRNLAKHLGSARYTRLIKAWRKNLETPAPKRSTVLNANRPVKQVASERIWRVYKRVLKEGRAIQPETPAEALHELRKTCKKLRYLMEFFISLYPTSEIKALIKVLKNFQDNLGEHQDFEVQVNTLKQFSQQMMAEGSAPAETLMAMGILVEDLSKRQQQARDEFASRFKQFSLPENQKHFRALFAYKVPELLAS